MPKYTQAHRPLRITTPLGPDELLLLGFTGQESISRPFLFELELMSENHEIDPNDVLRKSATVTLVLPDGSERHINGVISRFAQGGARADLALYRAELVAWFWFLSRSRDSKVFQNLSVLEIIEQVFKSRGYRDFAIRCAGNYPAREYCVQYNESDLDFVSRLLESEGIFYFFEHTDSKHTLVLADRSSTLEPCPGTPTARVAEQAPRDEDVITSLLREDSVFVGKMTLRDYDADQPGLTLSSSISGPGQGEIYEYQPVIFTDLAEGDRYARIRLEAEEARQRLIRGEGTCRAFLPGYRVDVERHYRKDMNGTYLITAVQHAARTSEFRTWDEAPFDYSNKFVGIPFDIPFRPRATTPKPVMRGSQTAVVVGKAGEEIWTDKYGRVKVQFHWDRDGKKDENSSCWMRVSSLWAGKGWGAIALPRIGQEVIVDFIEGDVDRPIIVGSVYNADQMQPYTFPADQTQSGIKSHSSKGGSADNFNELRFEDKKGYELVYLHAEKDEQVVVEYDSSESIGGNQSISIGGNRTEDVGGDESIAIAGDRTEDVRGNEKITIQGNRTEEVAGTESVQVKGNRECEVNGSETTNVGANQSISVKGNHELKVDGQLKIKAPNIDVEAFTVIISAEGALTLASGASTIDMDPSGITLKAPKIMLQGLASIELTAPIITGKADAMLDMKGAVAQLNGDGMVTVRGGLTMIN